MRYLNIIESYFKIYGFEHHGLCEGWEEDELGWIRYGLEGPGINSDLEDCTIRVTPDYKKLIITFDYYGDSDEVELSKKNTIKIPKEFSSLTKADSLEFMDWIDKQIEAIINS